MRSSFFRPVAAALFFVSTLALATPALAGKPILNNGVQISQSDPYSSAQVIDNIYDSKGIYGKLQAPVPVGIYKFTPDKDGEQQFTLLESQADKSGGQLLLILLDPTTATQAVNLSLPMPDPKYHAAVLKAAAAGTTYKEFALGQNYNVAVQDKVKLSKGITYYFVVIDPNDVAQRYAIVTGTGKAWTAVDVIHYFPTWLRLETDSYSGSNPFKSTSDVVGLVLFFLGLTALVGILIVQESFAWLANRAKSAGYLLVKLQPYSRVIIWVSLWFVLMGGFIYFDKAGWVGVPFVLFLLFIVFTINLLYLTFAVSPKVAKLEVNNREATISKPLRARWFVTSLISLLSVGGFIVLLSIYFVNH